MADLPTYAVEQIVCAIRESAGDAFAKIAAMGEDAMACQTRPSVLMRPALAVDGDHWCALYGENLQDGVAGFGKSPAEAMAAFDIAWHSKLPPRPTTDKET